MSNYETMSNTQFSYRTPFYSKLKQLNTDIHTFMQCSRVILPKHLQKKRNAHGFRTIDNTTEN